MNRRAFLQILGSFLLLFTEKAFGFFNVLMFKKKASGCTPSVVNLTISANTLKYNIFTAAGSPSSCVTVNLTIDPGVYVWSDSTATAAIEFGALPAGSTVTITNNGYIMGMGGKGGSCFNGTGNPGPGAAGGPAIRLTCPATINSQTGYVLGGGGGGGADGPEMGGGGGAGGGAGGDAESTSGPVHSYGGAGGAVGSSGAAGQYGTVGAAYYCGGGGGGRVVPSTTTAGPAPTTAPVAGTGGSGGGTGAAYYSTDSKFGGTGVGGSGGGPGVAGGNASSTTSGSSGAGGGAGGGGGGYGAAGGTGSWKGAAGFAGGAGGNAVVLNGKSVTWVGGLGANKVYGAIS
ncbi:MAG: hypothetical protein ACJ763_03995 [Bdellovibrionia bacterium]